MNKSTADLVAKWERAASRLQEENGASADDYSACLYRRTQIEQILDRTNDPLRSKLVEAVRRADDLFLDLTEHDAAELLGQYVNLSRVEGWWYRRIPKRGPIRRQLDGVADHERPD